MTLTDIIVSALQQTRRGDDSQTIKEYRDRYVQYANEAQQDLAKDFPVYRKENIVIENNLLDVSLLQRWCTKILSITKNGKAVYFDATGETGIIEVAENGEVTVHYRYLPKPLENLTDVPEIPEHLHMAMVTYVTARDITEGDASTQGGASVYFQLYNEQKQRLMRGGLGTPAAYKIMNMARW